MLILPAVFLVATDADVYSVQNMKNRKLSPAEKILRRQADQLAQDLAPLHDPTGVNTERAEHFIQALGIPLSRYAIVDAALTYEAQNALRKTSLPEDKITGRFHGRHYPLLNYALIYKGSTYPTERTLVHELGHRSITLPLPSGFTILKNKILGRPFPPLELGFTGSSFNLESAVEMAVGSYAQLLQGKTDCYSDILLPKKYERDHPYSYGSVALEALCTRTPELVDYLLTANHNPEAVTKAKDVYDDIQPGLFEHLDQGLGHLNDSELCAAYENGLMRVLDATGYTCNDIPDIHAQGVVVNRVQTLLDTYTSQTGYIFKADAP